MRGANVLGLIFANAGAEECSELTGIRSMASVPFAGGYRLIDFVLSDMVNSGMKKVGIITNSNYQSLMDHVGSGQAWDLARKSEGLYMLPPFNAEAVANYYESRLGALKNITGFLSKSAEEYVLLADSNCVLNTDLSGLFAFHEEKDADITLVYDHGTVPRIKSVTLPDINEEGRVTKIALGTPGEEDRDFGINIILMKKSLLERFIAESHSKGYSSFERNILQANTESLRIFAFKPANRAYIIDSLASYFKIGMELTDKENYRALFNKERPVFTKVYDDMPAVYGLESSVKNSLIADGCHIEGTVENSILFRDCRIGKGAVVRNSILMPHTVVGDGASLSYCVADKSVVIRSGKTLSGAETWPIYFGKGILI